MEFTRPATWDDLKTLARYLDQAGAEYALVGGFAIAAHGFNRFTEDIDILVNPSPEIRSMQFASVMNSRSTSCPRSQA